MRLGMIILDSEVIKDVNLYTQDTFLILLLYSKQYPQSVNIHELCEASVSVKIVMKEPT